MEDEEFVLFRGVWNGEPFPLLALGGAAFAGKPNAVAARLCASGRARPRSGGSAVEREPRGGRLTLLSEDPGGELLSRLLGRPWGITSFLRVAVRRRVHLRVFGSVWHDLRSVRASCFASVSSFSPQWPSRLFTMASRRTTRAHALR
jgi:hypothetical protein